MEMNEQLVDEILINKIESLFIKKEISEKNQAVIGAVITVASELAKYSNITDSITTTNELLNLYKKNNDPVVNSLLGMIPSYVESTIGFNADFKEPAMAKNYYEERKAEYDEIYREIDARSKQNEDIRILA